MKLGQHPSGGGGTTARGLARPPSGGAVPPDSEGRQVLAGSVIDNRRNPSDAPDAWEKEDSVLLRFSRSRTLWGRTRYKIRRAYNYVIRLRGSPEEISWGLSLGLFIAMTPTVGLQMTIAVPVATALRGNPAAAAAGCWLTNPLTIPFLYGLNYWIGAMILGYDLEMSFGNNLTFEMLLQSGGHVWWSLILGGVITGTICAAASYYPTLKVVRAGRERFHRTRERHLARKQAKQIKKKRAPKK